MSMFFIALVMTVSSFYVYSTATHRTASIVLAVAGAFIASSLIRSA